MENENVEKGEVKKTEFEPAKFKEDMMNEQRQTNETMMNDMVSKMTGMMDDKLSTVREPVKSKKVNAELSNELELLGIDEDQASAIVSLVNKRSENLNPEDLEKRVMDKVTSTNDIANKKKDLEANTASKFPDVLNPVSRLWKEAQKIYNSFDDSAKNSYMATSLAVESAANKLGIQPIDLNNIRASQAINNTNGGGHTVKEVKKITQKTLDFGTSFGLDPKIFEKHLKDKL